MPAMNENEAATAIAARQKGKLARNEAATKKSKIWQAMRRPDLPLLTELLAKSSAAEICVLDQEGRTPLAAAIVESRYDCAKLLIECDDALNVPSTQLAIWQRVQKEKKAAEDEENEEPVDVNDPEWQKSTAEEFFGPDVNEELDGPVKAIVTIGVFVGGRAERDPTIEPTFDTELTHRLGFGTALAPHGDVYVGDFGAGGERHGLGALRTASGTVYVGGWLNGKRHGEGMMTYADGGKYIGAWAYGKRQGRGTFLFPNGDSYTGEWTAGNKHGSGRYRNPTLGCTYEGTWQQGVLKASKVVSSDGTSYYGKFDKMGRPVGSGAYVFPNGSVARGTYAAPQPAEEEEAEEEEGAKPPSATWSGSTIANADHSVDPILKRDLCAVKPIINVVIAGAPASGKGTQCEKISEMLGLVHISTGDMLRKAAEDEEDELGQKVIICDRPHPARSTSRTKHIPHEANPARSTSRTKPIPHEAHPARSPSRTPTVPSLNSFTQLDPYPTIPSRTPTTQSMTGHAHSALHPTPHDHHQPILIRTCTHTHTHTHSHLHPHPHPFAPAPTPTPIRTPTPHTHIPTPSPSSSHNRTYAHTLPSLY